MQSPACPDNLSDVTPGNDPWPRVEFRGQARPEPAARRQQCEREFAHVFGSSRCDVEVVFVLRRYGGYSEANDDKTVFGVELRLRDDLGYETHIVKFGSDAEVGSDADNWDACTKGREVASRIFASARKVPIRKSGRVAVLYRDAYTLFGPSDGADVTPNDLETVAWNAVFTNTVDPESVERAIAHIFTDLQLWFFFPGAAPNADAARAFYCKELVSKKSGLDALALWSTDSQRLDLRRDALWLFCGRDKPDVNHDIHPARYLDPAELVGWALDTNRIPETLVGRGHGDLHGRNVLLGVRRSAAEYPAVFDYGGMGNVNVLAWDFAKLETELKVRLLQHLYRNDAAARLHAYPLLWTWGSAPAQRDAISDLAEHLRFYFVFEELLAEATEWITGAEIAKAWWPPGDRDRNRTGVPELDRLLALLLRIRQEAALALGFATAGRVDKWRDELYFALAVCGLVNARWDTYTEPQRQSALVSAGVAAAHARFARQAIAEQSRQVTPPPAPHPSYRVPLAHAHRLWKGISKDEGKQLLDELKDRYSHAVPLLAEYALFRCDAGEFASVQKQLSDLRTKAVAFDDEETLSRLGRAFKEMGDESWDKSGLAFAQLGNHPSMQFYRNAFEVYEDAYRLSNHYYPGINVAALALFLEEKENRAKEVAEELRDQCTKMTVPPEEFYWVFATEGDAALILRDSGSALKFYRNAIDVLQKGEEQYSVSSYRQLLRLRGPLGAALVDPVLKLFDDNAWLGPVLRQQVRRRIPG